MSLTSLELRVVEKVLEMDGGYVLDFSNRSFADFFAEYGVDVYASQFANWGSSKANRLRSFLHQAQPPVIGRVLAGLLAHRRAIGTENVEQRDLEAFARLATRLGGQVEPMAPAEPTTEAELLRRVFRVEVFARLPGDAVLHAALVGRMEEARQCVQAGAYLATVILCGSVLEGICLGYGSRFPERVNRAWASHFNRPVPKLQDWKLVEWIGVLERLGAFSPNIAKFGQALREFRNYVHPAEQLAHRFSPDAHTARIGFQVVVAAAEDVVRHLESGGAPQG